MIVLPYNAAIPLLSIYPKNKNINSESYMLHFITALLKIVKVWKQPQISIRR